MRSYLNVLHDSQVQIGDTTFNRLVQKLIHGNQGQLLHDIVTCDMHRNVFEDGDLQSSLLNQYKSADNQAGIERTMAILLTDTPKADEPRRRLNILLKSSLARKDKIDVE